MLSLTVILVHIIICLPISKVTCTSEYETNCILIILYQLNFFCFVSICLSTVTEGVSQNGA